MKSEVKQMWTAALRSGEYKQAKDRLKSKEGYCCLGVLCEVAVKEGVIGPAQSDEHEEDEYFYPDGEDRAGGVLPNAVAEWAGLESPNPIVDGGTLVRRNDSERDGWDFNRLADLIEREL
ncbi:hypothetical protein [Plantactinospora sp. WMMB782]|uniref:hypothetical protein n=1 Tax=Plantactinospora sp. WMMB782 TaxID=3404121 RepID=UPI003B92CA2F